MTVRFFLFWWSWQFWGLVVNHSVECPSAGICLKFFSKLGCGYGFLAGNLQKKCAIFITLYQKYMLSTEFITTDVDFHHLLMWYLSGSLFLPSPHFHPCSLERSHGVQPIPTVGCYRAHFLVEYLCELFGNSWMGVLVLLSYFSIYISMDPRIFILCYFNPTQIVSSN